MDRGRIDCAAAPTFSSDRASGTIAEVNRKPRVRVSRFPAPDTREQALASLATMLDQHEDDEVLEQHERGQRALLAAKKLATARTRAAENNAYAALIAIGLEEP